jgi:DNA polymerase-3 subunit epsilon
VHGSPSAAPWADALDRAERSTWPTIAGDAEAQWVQRDPMTTDDVVPTPSFLARAVVKLPDYTGPEEHLDYLALLDLCLLDPVLSPRETLELRVLAEFSGISATDRTALHRRYFEDLVRVAGSNGALSVADSADLIAVARMLDVAPDVVAAALAEPSAARPPIATIETVLLEAPGSWRPVER